MACLIETCLYLLLLREINAKRKILYSKHLYEDYATAVAYSMRLTATAAEALDMLQHNQSAFFSRGSSLSIVLVSFFQLLSIALSFSLFLSVRELSSSVSTSYLVQANSARYACYVSVLETGTFRSVMLLR